MTGGGGEIRPADEAAQVTMLEQGLWRSLGRADDLTEAARAWAPLMYGQVDATEGVVVFLADPEGGRLRPVANYPEARLPGGAMIAAAEQAVDGDRGVVRGGVGEGGALTGGLVAIASPLSLDGTVRGAVVLELEPTDQAHLRAAMRRLQWGGAWLRDLLRKDAAREDGRKYAHAIEALNAVVTVAEQGRIATATRAAATDLATRFRCDRVSIGFRRLFRVKLSAISNSAQFAKQMKLVRQIGAAMDEAIDQRGVILWPPDEADPPMAAHRHEALARAQGSGQILTTPLYAGDHFVGAITFERPETDPFDQDDVDILEAIATVLAPILEEKRRNDRWVITKALEATGRQVKRLLGPGFIARKLIGLTALAIIAFLWFATGPDRVTADATIEGVVQRTVAAPFDGFVAETFARAGDTVSEGDVLLRLDDRELALDRLRLVTELQRQRIEFDRALASRDRAETQVRRSQIEQSEARIALVDAQIARTRLIAPFDGIVISGDLTQSIGSAVARGQPLLTVAPSRDYRIAMAVDERRIADVTEGQTGTLVVTALPERGFPFEVTKITPVAEYGDGATTFRVEGALTVPPDAIQPGMEGIAKVDIGEARLAAIWTRPLVDWSRLWAWRWLDL